MLHPDARAPFRLTVSAAEPVDAARRAAAALPSGGVLYYALGGGLGHLTRGLAIHRHLTRLSPLPFVLLTNCRVPVPEPAATLHLQEETSDPGSLGRLVAELIAALRPAVFAVDAFPAGILGELPPLLPGLGCRRVAILRLLQDTWMERWNLPSLLTQAYDAAAVVEPGALPAGTARGWERRRLIETAPVLIRDAAELLNRSEARRRFGIEGNKPLVCASVTGARPADQGILGVGKKAVANARPEAAVRFLTPFPGGMPAGEYRFHFPLLEWMAGVDLLIGPCGYNLCHEAAAAGVPTIFVPQSRRYDDQFRRAQGRIVARSSEELEQHVRAILDRVTDRSAPHYENGAGPVAELLADLAR